MKVILLIEDNQGIRENTLELLVLEGYRVETADNGRSGFEMALKIVPDLILSDIAMPEMNGYELFNALRAVKATSGIPFIFMTASVERKEVEFGLGLGANGYISKPFEVDELLDEVIRCLT